MTSRLRQLNFFALTIIVVYTMAVVKIVAKTPIVNPVVDSILVFLTSVGFYQILIESLFGLFSEVPLLLRLYWGKLYVAGFWSYTYSLDGKDDSTVYFGVWRFEQSLYDTKVVGFGLTDKFIARSRVRSMTDMIKNGAMHEFINIRSDSVDSGVEYYSRTSMYFELNKKRFFRYPTRMRGRTHVYGGPLNGRICNNYFVKHENAQTEQDVVDELKQHFKTHGTVHPDGH